MDMVSMIEGSSAFEFYMQSISVSIAIWLLITVSLSIHCLAKKEIQTPFLSQRRNRIFWFIGISLLWNPLVQLFYAVFVIFNAGHKRRWVKTLPLIFVCVQLARLFFWVVLMALESDSYDEPFVLTAGQKQVEREPSLPKSLVNLSYSVTAYKDKSQARSSSSMNRPALSYFPAKYLLVRVTDGENISKRIGEALAIALISHAGITTVYFQPDGKIPGAKRIDLMLNLSSTLTMVNIPLGPYAVNGHVKTVLRSLPGRQLIGLSSEQDIQYSGTLAGMDVSANKYKPTTAALAKLIKGMVVATIATGRKDLFYAGDLPDELFTGKPAASIPGLLSVDPSNNVTLSSFAVRGSTMFFYPSLACEKNTAKKPSDISRVRLLHDSLEGLKKNGWSKASSSWSGSGWSGAFHKNNDTISYSAVVAEEQGGMPVTADLNMVYAQGYTKNEMEDIVDGISAQNRYSKNFFLGLVDYLPDERVEVLIKSLKSTDFANVKDLLSVIRNVKKRIQPDTLKGLVDKIRGLYFLSGQRPRESEIKKLTDELSLPELDLKTALSAIELKAGGAHILIPYGKGVLPLHLEKHVGSSRAVACAVAQVRLNERAVFYDAEKEKALTVRIFPSSDQEGNRCYAMETSTNGHGSATSFHKIKESPEVMTIGFNAYFYTSIPSDRKDIFDIVILREESR